MADSDDDFFAEQQRQMDMPDEDIDELIARRRAWLIAHPESAQVQARPNAGGSAAYAGNAANSEPAASLKRKESDSAAHDLGAGMKKQRSEINVLAPEEGPLPPPSSSPVQLSLDSSTEEESDYESQVASHMKKKPSRSPKKDAKRPGPQDAKGVCDDPANTPKVAYTRVTRSRTQADAPQVSSPTKRARSGISSRIAAEAAASPRSKTIKRIAREDVDDDADTSNITSPEVSMIMDAEPIPLRPQPHPSKRKQAGKKKVDAVAPTARTGAKSPIPDAAESRPEPSTSDSNTKATSSRAAVLAGTSVDVKAKAPAKSRAKQPAADKEKEKAKPKAKTKEKPALVTPVEYAQSIIAKAQERAQKRAAEGALDAYPGCLAGKVIFFAGGDLRWASERTRGRMDLLVRNGATLQPTFDPTTVTHIVADVSSLVLLKEMGLKKLNEIPAHVPTVKWSYIVEYLSIGKRKMEEATDKKHLAIHALIQSRKWVGTDVMLYGQQKAAQLARQNTELASIPANEGELSRISMFTEDKSRPGSRTSERSQRTKSPSDSEDENGSNYHPESDSDAELRKAFIGKGKGREQVTSTSEKTAANLASLPTPSDAKGTDKQDPLAEFIAQARAEAMKERGRVGSDTEGEDVTGQGDPDASTDGPAPLIPRAEPKAVKGVYGKRTFGCDIVGGRPPPAACPNQDIVDQLEQLVELHKGKPSDDDHWRAFSGGKATRALRRYPKRITSYEEAVAIPGVGHRTALKIMEIIQTGDLQRLKYEKTPDVAATKLFQGIYGVGQGTAYAWFSAGCRTLEDVRQRKGDIKLNAAQEIGLEFYDGRLASCS